MGLKILNARFISDVEGGWVALTELALALDRDKNFVWNLYFEKLNIEGYVLIAIPEYLRTHGRSNFILLSVYPYLVYHSFEISTKGTLLTGVHLDGKTFHGNYVFGEPAQFLENLDKIYLPFEEAFKLI
jgi:hypothetical protein